MLDRDAVTGLLFAAIGMGFAIAGMDYGIGSARRMGPGFFPVMIGGALVLVGAALAVRGLIARSRSDVSRLHIRPLLALTAAVLAFAFTIDRFGIVIACLACVLTSGLASPTTRWRETGLVALAMAVFSALVFVQFLALPMEIWPEW